MTRCDLCGAESQAVAPYVRHPPTTVGHAVDGEQLLPRSALTDEQNAAIPWGLHPSDDMFGVACLPCVDSLSGASA